MISIILMKIIGDPIETERLVYVGVLVACFIAMLLTSYYRLMELPNEKKRHKEILNALDEMKSIDIKRNENHLKALEEIKEIDKRWNEESIKLLEEMKVIEKSINDGTKPLYKSIVNFGVRINKIEERLKIKNHE